MVNISVSGAFMEMAPALRRQVMSTLCGHLGLRPSIAHLRAMQSPAGQPFDGPA